MPKRSCSQRALRPVAPDTCRGQQSTSTASSVHDRAAETLDARMLFQTARFPSRPKGHVQTAGCEATVRASTPHRTTPAARPTRVNVYCGLSRLEALNELKFFHGMAESQAIKFHCRGTQLATLFSRAMTASHLTAQSRSSAVYKRQHCSLVAERARPPAVARAHSHRGSLMLALCTCVHM